MLSSVLSKFFAIRYLVIPIFTHSFSEFKKSYSESSEEKFSFLKNTFGGASYPFPYLGLCKGKCLSGSRLYLLFSDSQRLFYVWGRCESRWCLFGDI